MLHASACNCACVASASLQLNFAICRACAYALELVQNALLLILQHS